MEGHNDVDLVTGRTFTTNPWRSNSTGGGGGGGGVGSNLQVVPYPQAIDRHGFDQDAAAKPAPKLKTSTSWIFDDPELKRRRRVASYRAYSVEGRVKSTLRKSVRWFKDKCLDMRYGWW